jgi:hypothetical protein
MTESGLRVEVDLCGLVVLRAVVCFVVVGFAGIMPPPGLNAEVLLPPPAGIMGPPGLYDRVASRFNISGGNMGPPGWAVMGVASEVGAEAGTIGPPGLKGKVLSSSGIIGPPGWNDRMLSRLVGGRIGPPGWIVIGVGSGAVAGIMGPPGL